MACWSKSGVAGEPASDGVWATFLRLAVPPSLCGVAGEEASLAVAAAAAAEAPQQHEHQD